MKTVTLKKMKVCAIHYINEQLLEQFAIDPDIAFSQHVQFMSNDIAMRVVQRVFGKTLEEVHEKYPADWRQSLKERFAPAWFLKRWPVVYKHIDIVARALYPKIPNIPVHKAEFQMEMRVMTE